MTNSFILAVLATFFISANMHLCRSKQPAFDVIQRHPSLCAELGLRTGRVIVTILSNQSALFRPWPTGPPDDALNSR